MQKKPKVTVIMPAYNAEKYIALAIESILKQTFKDFEFIIINDCSTDKTKEIITKYQKKDNRIVLVNNETNLKIAKTLNKGIHLAKGKYIARMDADDWSYPYRLEKQVKHMDKNPNTVLLSGKMQICDGDMNIRKTSNFPINNNEILNAILQYNPLVSPAMMWRKQPSLDIQGFKENTITEDYMFVLDMSQKGELHNLDDVLIKYRVVDSSMTSTKMRGSHLSSINVSITGHLKYNYPLTLKTQLIILARLFIAFFVPASIWRFLSSYLRK